jgi:hypothetical protein
VNVPFKNYPWRRFQKAQADDFAFRASVTFGQHYSEWRATEQRGGKVRVFRRVCNDCEIKLAGANTSRQLACISGGQVNTQVRVKRKFHRAEDIDQSPIRKRRSSHHNLAVNSVHCFASSEDGAL